MGGPVRRIVILPRYTAFYGATTFRTVPMNARDFAEVVLTAWRGNDLGSSSVSAAFQLEQSPDADAGTWSAVGTALAPTVGNESTDTFSIEQEWVRLAVTVSGGDLGLTTWVVGDFVPRETAGTTAGR